LFSRASYIGMHRYGGVWQGDNKSWWSHILLNLRMLPSLNMCGFLYTGADLGGFNCDATEDLLLRWYALGVFTPLMRNHSAWDTRRQEFYAFGDTEDYRSVLELRYALLPYIYSEFVKAALSGGMFLRPLGFDFPGDDRALRCEDELLAGEGLLVAPVCEENARGRYVYLPEDMTRVSWRRGKIRTQEMAKGSYYIYVPLDSVTFFVRKGRLVPLCAPAKDTGSLDTSRLSLVGTGESYGLYEDDGLTRDIRLEGHVRTLTR
ncbi:MAG: alpha-glucosidase, partial [Treponema sp.]|nr:alpha-glucosidase [Treponema sp.]